MKAILRSNRKVIVDVEWYDTWVDCGKMFYHYIDKNTKKVYHEEELDFVEYYGG